MTPLPAALGGTRLVAWRLETTRHFSTWDTAQGAFLAGGRWSSVGRRVKTTLNLNDQLLADAKVLAAQQRTSLTRLIEEGLQLRLRAKAASAKQGLVRLPVFKGRGGLVAGVDPLSNKALLEAPGDDA